MRSPDLVVFPFTDVAVATLFDMIVVMLASWQPTTKVIHTPPDQMYKIADWGQQ